MADFIQKMFMTPQQRALFNAADSAPVQMQSGFLMTMNVWYKTTVYSANTDMGKIKATFAKQDECSAMKPQDFYSVEVINETNITNEQNGRFAKAMYKKLKHRYDQSKKHVR